MSGNDAKITEGAKELGAVLPEFVLATLKFFGGGIYIK